MTDEQPDDQPAACSECARAIALGWFGAIARHRAAEGRPVCVLCGEGEATLTPGGFFETVGALIQARTADGKRRSWRDDVVRGLGVTSSEN